MSRKAIDHSRCYTPEQVAERWLVSQRTVKRMLESGQLRGFRVGDMTSSKCRWRISPEELLRFEATTINADGQLVEVRQHKTLRRGEPLPPVKNWLGTG